MDWDKIFRKYLKFTSYVFTTTKEKGVVRQSWKNKLNTQKIFATKFFEMKKNGKHKIVVLKPRQSAISTESRIINLFFCYMFKNFTISTIMHDEKYIPEFRDSYKEMSSNLLTLVSDNRNIISFRKNNSLSKIYFYATRSRSANVDKEGRSSNSVALHATELAFYSNMFALDAIQAALPDRNPLKYIIYESTTTGTNFFTDEYINAKTGATSEALFLGWWTHDFYRVPKNSNIYQQYITYDKTEAEIEMLDNVKNLYGYDITPEQLCWWRWKLAETYRRDPSLLRAEYPATEQESWEIASEERFYSPSDLKQCYVEKDFDSLKIKLEIDRTQEIPRRFIAVPNNNDYNLKIYEYPEKLGVYVAGIDPASTANPDSDEAVISIYRVKNKGQILEQVAEFNDCQLTPVVFAYYVAFLCVFYNSAYYNLEVTGPGGAVQETLKRAEILLPSLEVAMPEQVRNILRQNMHSFKLNRAYLYGREDALRASYRSLGTMTTRNEKEKMLFTVKDMIRMQQLIIHSDDLISEMANIDKDTLSARVGHDDLHMGTALACRMFRKTIYEHIWKETVDTETIEAEQKNVFKNLVDNTPGVNLI